MTPGIRVPSVENRHVGIALVTGITAAMASFYLPGERLSQLFQTLVVAEASLLAIIVSVGLLSIQIAATQFTPLIGRRLKEKQFLTDILHLFGISISLALIGMVLAPPLTSIVNPLSNFLVGTLTFFGVGSATVSFFSLIKTKNEVLEYLDPKPVLDELLDHVSFERYRRFSEQSVDEESPPPRSPVLEIFQIGQRALEENDGDTAVYAIYTLNRASNKIMHEFGTTPEKERKEIYFQHQDLFRHWERLVDAAVEHGTDTPLYRIATSQKEIAVLAAEKGLEGIGSEAAGTLKYVCKKSYREGRLEKSYYHRFQPILEKSIEYEATNIAEYTIFSMKLLMFDLAKNVRPEVDNRSIESRVIEGLFAYYRDSWSKLLKDKCREIEKGELRKIHDGFESDIGHYIWTCWAHDSPYPRKLESNLVSVATSAAENDEQWAVCRLTRMLVELFVITEIGESEVVRGIIRIMNSNGRKGVEEAFDHILGFEFTPDSELELVRVSEKGLVEKIEGRDEKLYQNVIANLPRLNSIEGFEQEVQRLREAVESKSEE